ncbi:anti-sigma factor domain-containing protein [Methylocapsa sp. S129]|uniref:anti-sigma factor n=1 Tax=Methylocapsa sp. S129 TaxID=1641869 RepID=UPI00131C27C5|nr:anti-sigma factor [Methylocapsa sp. S129]
MSLNPDDDFNAAEFALGTLDGGERASLAARRLREPELDAAIVAWEMRLAPLSESIPALAPPRDFLGDIEARIQASAQNAGQSGNVVDLTRRLRRWRFNAIAASAIAAALAIGIGLRESTRVSTPHEFVAVLQKSADSPAFIITVNLDSRDLTVRPVAAPPQPDKAYELWIINDKLGAPRSLGVIDNANLTANPSLNRFDRAIVENATYAVTIEPPGGSPTGAPSGAPVFVGKLFPTGP